MPLFPAKARRAWRWLVERKTRFFLVILLKDKTASAMHEAVTQGLSGLPAGMRRTLTYDKGLENALHGLRNLELGVRSYFYPVTVGRRGRRKPERDIEEIFSQKAQLALDDTGEDR